MPSHISKLYFISYLKFPFMKNVVTPAIIGFSIIISALFLAKAYTYKFKATETINVTGMAEKNFTSDLIVWNGNYARKSMDLKTAYAMLKQDEQKIKSYLKGKGLPDSAIVYTAVNINKEFNYRYNSEGGQIAADFTGYNLTQWVTVQSTEIDKVELISREVTELIESGVEFNSAAPSYYYTKLADLKLDLLAKAAEDARNRASTIAKNSGSGLGDVRKVNMGVFQITAENGNEDYSSGGVFNTASRNKTASITMKVEYEIN